MLTAPKGQKKKKRLVIELLNRYWIKLLPLNRQWFLFSGHSTDLTEPGLVHVCATQLHARLSLFCSGVIA